MLAGQDLEQRLFLRWIKRQAQRRHVAEELFQDVVAIHGAGRRGQQRGLASIKSRAGHKCLTATVGSLGLGRGRGSRRRLQSHREREIDRSVVTNGARGRQESIPAQLDDVHGQIPAHLRAHGRGREEPPSRTMSAPGGCESMTSVAGRSQTAATGSGTTTR